MKAPIATELVAFDACLPARDVMVDPGAAVQRLGAILSEGAPLVIQRATLLTVKYRWQESLRVAYRLLVDGTELTVAGRMFATAALAERAASEARARVTVQPRAPFRAVTLDQALRTVWFVAPADRRLRHLDALVDPPAHLASLPLGQWVASELVQYAPERSATFRALDGAGATVGYAKLYRHRTDAGELTDFYRQVMAALADRGAKVRVPNALSSDHGLGVMVLEPVPGLAWNEINRFRLPSVTAEIGEALATIHGLDRFGRRPFERLCPDHVGRAVELIAGARPDQAQAARAIGDRLRATVPDLSGPVLLHGDVHPKNVLVDTSVSLIDLDQAGWGSAANDLASMVARLRHGALTGEIETAREADLRRAFLEGYQRVRPLVPAAELRWHIAAALVLERALRALTRLQPEGLRVLPQTLEAAANELEAR